MSKYKLVSYLFVILGLLVITGASYIIVMYATGLINAVVDFVTTNDHSKLQQCGVSPPTEFAKLKNEFATLVLPALYLGIPAVLIVVSALMFLAGTYYYRGKLEDEGRKHEELERQMVHKIVKKMETERVPAPSKPPAPEGRQQGAYGQAADEPEEAAAMDDEPPADEPEELPRPKPAAKKRK